MCGGECGEADAVILRFSACKDLHRIDGTGSGHFDEAVGGVCFQPKSAEVANANISGRGDNRVDSFRLSLSGNPG